MPEAAITAEKRTQVPTAPVRPNETPAPLPPAQADRPSPSHSLRRRHHRPRRNHQRKPRRGQPKRRRRRNLRRKPACVRRRHRRRRFRLPCRHRRCRRRHPRCPRPPRRRPMRWRHRRRRCRGPARAATARPSPRAADGVSTPASARGGLENGVDLAVRDFRRTPIIVRGLPTIISGKSPASSRATATRRTSMSATAPPWCGSRSAGRTAARCRDRRIERRAGVRSRRAGGCRSGSPYDPLPADIQGASATFTLPLVSVNRHDRTRVAGDRLSRSTARS